MFFTTTKNATDGRKRMMISVPSGYCFPSKYKPVFFVVSPYLYQRRHSKIPLPICRTPCWRWQTPSNGEVLRRQQLPEQLVLAAWRELARGGGAGGNSRLYCARHALIDLIAPKRSRRVNNGGVLNRVFALPCCARGKGCRSRGCIALLGRVCKRAGVKCPR